MGGVTDFHVDIVKLLFFFLVGVRLILLLTFALFLFFLLFVLLGSSKLDFSR